MDDNSKAQREYVERLRTAYVVSNGETGGFEVHIVDSSDWMQETIGSIRAYRDSITAKAAAAMWQAVLGGDVQPIVNGRALVLVALRRKSVETYRESNDGTGIPDFTSRYTRKAGEAYWWVSSWEAQYEYSADPAVLEAYGLYGVRDGLQS